MNDLSGKCVNVVLAVEMGRGMEFLEHPVKIIATFNGRPLESDLVEPDECPLFNTELVWETEKKQVRKVRSTNVPIRVEVQFVDKNQRKDRVGFILLSPRSASIIPFDSKLEIPFKWQKLLGVAAENKGNHPELYLSLTIRDLAKSVETEQPYLVNITSEEETDTGSEQPQSPKDGQTFPMQYLPDGFIQIGNDECTETFLLSITIQVAYNLDLLLPEVLVFNQSREKYFISFKMFGITIKSKPFCRDLHANIPMNEKIVVRLRSDYDVLKAYLSEQCRIVVSFYCGRDKLGTTKLCVNKLLQNVTEEEFLTSVCTAMCEQNCFFKFPSAHGIVPTGPNSRQPYIEVGTSLKRTEIRPKSANNIASDVSIESVAVLSTESMAVSSEDKLETASVEETELNPNDDAEVVLSVSAEALGADTEERMSPKEQTTPRNIDFGCGDVAEEVDKNETQVSPAVSACGDQIDESKTFELQALDLELTRIEKNMQSEESLNNSSELCNTSLLKKAPPLPSPDPTITLEDIDKKIFLYQQYCLDIIVENITLKKHIKSKTLCFKFKHPKAASVTMLVSEMDNQDNEIGEDIILENTRCKMFFISSTEHIRKMVYAWAPKLVLTDENDQILTEELDLYTAMFLAKHRTECSYVTEWKAVRTYEPLVKIKISMYLQEYGLTAFPKPTDFDLLPPILDEEISIKELQDLQEWKEIQRAQFSADLKIVEKQRMAKLQKDWAKRKKELEGKLTNSVIRCQNLSQELQAAVNTIRTKKALERKEAELNSQPNCSLEDNVLRNLLKYSDVETRVLIETISKLERNNEHLKGIIDDQRQEIQQIKKTALTKEQTTNLLHQLRGLEEKFEEAQKAKSYFKDQWKKAVREIHDLRSEEQKQIQEKLQNHKIELSQLSLDTFVSGEIGGAKFEYGQNGTFELSQNAFPARKFTSSSFGDYKWDNLDISLGISQSKSGTYNANNI